jgi:hypothetical protein
VWIDATAESPLLNSQKVGKLLETQGRKDAKAQGNSYKICFLYVMATTFSAPLRRCAAALKN